MDVVCDRYVYFMTRWKGKRETDMLHSCIAKKKFKSCFSFVF